MQGREPGRHPAFFMLPSIHVLLGALADLAPRTRRGAPRGAMRSAGAATRATAVGNNRSGQARGAITARASRLSFALEVATSHRQRIQRSRRLMLDLSVIEQVVIAARVDAESILGLHPWGANRRTQREGDEKKGFLHESSCSYSFEDGGNPHRDCLSTCHVPQKAGAAKNWCHKRGAPSRQSRTIVGPSLPFSPVHFPPLSIFQSAARDHVAFYFSSRLITTKHRTRKITVKTILSSSPTHSAKW